MRPATHKLVLVFVLSLLLTPAASAYAVLTHEAIVDTLWKDSIVPLLKARFPDVTDDQLLEAHAYAYGGCIIQDLGYYPFGNHLFSDLAHYVRSADFIQSLVSNAGTLDEFAFAIGAAAHYAADVDGHSIAVNRAVPMLYPRLKRKYGDVVTYEDDPGAHLKTEFGFDVLQVARGHYAPKSYHDFIGFEVSKDLLDKAFQETYGLKLKDVFKMLDLALGTYRFSMRTVIPDVTRAAWDLKKDEITKAEPTMTRKRFIYELNRASYRKEWGARYRTPGIGTRILAFLLRILPKIGPLRGLAFKMPTPPVEQLFQKSFDASVQDDQKNFATIRDGKFTVPDRDLDTGKLVAAGEYKLTDRTYDQLLKKIASKHFDGVTPELRANILKYYGEMKTPDPHGTAKALAALKAQQPAD